MLSLTLLAHAGASDEIASSVLLFGAVWIAWIGWSRLREKGFPRMSRSLAWMMMLAAAALLVAGLFVPRAILGPTVPATAPGDRIASTASLSIDAPSPPGRLVTGATLVVVLDLRGGTVVDASTTDLTADTGHLHLALDGEQVSMTYGTVQPLDVGGLAPGEHELLAEYVAADHAPFDPRVTAGTTFRTGGAAS